MLDTQVVINRIKFGLPEGSTMGLSFQNNEVVLVSNISDPTMALKLLDLAKAEMVKKV